VVAGIEAAEAGKRKIIDARMYALEKFIAQSEEGAAISACTVRVINHRFCYVRVRIIGLRLLYGWRVFRQTFTLEDAIGSHAFAPPLEALACV
jgi:hypothetical protein